jgi:hypothetical protein
MTEFFYNRFDQSVGSLKGSSEQSVIEAFSDPKEYNQKYVDQAGFTPETIKTYAPNPTACPTSGLDTNTCVKEYAYNADKYNKLTHRNTTANGSFGDSKDKHSEIVISNINLGIGIAMMLAYIYSTN